MRIVERRVLRRGLCPLAPTTSARVPSGARSAGRRRCRGGRDGWNHNGAAGVLAEILRPRTPTTAGPVRCIGGLSHAAGSPPPATSTSPSEMTKCGASVFGRNNRQSSPARSCGKHAKHETVRKLNRSTAAFVGLDARDNQSSTMACQQLIELGILKVRALLVVPIVTVEVRASLTGSYRSILTVTIPSGPWTAPRALDVERELTDGARRST